MDTCIYFQSPAEFHLPRYKEIPNVGLYLEQCAKYVNMHLGVLGYPELTSSMISNYVKQKIISGPQKKQYGADHIACLMILVIMKSVLSIEDAHLILDVKRDQYDIATGYDIFCQIFEAQLQHTFKKGAGNDSGKAAILRKKETHESPADGIIHNVILAAVQKIYLDMQINALRKSVRERKSTALLEDPNTKKKEKENKKNPDEASVTSKKEGEQNAVSDDDA